MLFDTHAHYDDERFDEDRLEVLQTLHKSGVTYVLNAASDIQSSKESVGMAHKFHFVYAAVGVHPHEVSGMSEDMMTEVASLSKDPKVVAIGEIGLDYYYDYAPRETQKHWFARQIGLARELGFPVVIHDREAHEDTMKIVKEEKAKEVGGVLHCFSGSVEMAKDVLGNNFYISVGGSVTFKKARRIIDVVKYVPLDRILLETDSPYLTPEPHRGKRNDSSYIPLIAEKIAEIKKISFEEVVQQTTQNAKTLFQIE